MRFLEAWFLIKRVLTHSLRSGGATAAANAGVPDRLFLRHGRWSSVSAKDGYVKDSLASRLSVFRHLGFLFLLVLPGGPSDLGFSWPGVFLLGASGRTERFFTQLLSHNPISVAFAMLVMIVRGFYLAFVQ